MKSIYKCSGPLKTVASELEQYQIDPVTVQEVRWHSGGSQPADNNTFFYRKWNTNHHIETGRLLH